MELLTLSSPLFLLPQVTVCRTATYSHLYRAVFNATEAGAGADDNFDSLQSQSTSRFLAPLLFLSLTPSLA